MQRKKKCPLTEPACAIKEGSFRSDTISNGPRRKWASCGLLEERRERIFQSWWLTVGGKTLSRHMKRNMADREQVVERNSSSLTKSGRFPYEGVGSAPNVPRPRKHSNVDL
ncbi:hypothetical protein CHARACLAT_001812 [Characodon lateralis]|uniref:Uncharacterized protein n=1 Tax=Characodon lateralis TaxID=208331 RepID=A0ABU7DWZ8_9TELE|nr:hypothetical protein [Characodon lateralis]